MGLLSGSKPTSSEANEAPFAVATLECRASDGRLYSFELDRDVKIMRKTLGLSDANQVTAALAQKVAAFLDHPDTLPEDPNTATEGEKEASDLLHGAIQELLRLCDEGHITSITCLDDDSGHNIVLAARHVVSVF